MAGVTAQQIVVKITTDTSAAKQGMKDVEEQGKGTGSRMKGILDTALSFAGAQIGIATVSDAFGFLKDQVTDAWQAGEDANRVIAQTAAVLKSTHDASGQSAQSIADFATQMMHVTGIDDDAVQSAENMLLTFDNIKGNTFPQATKAALDMATAMNGGATPSAEQLRQTSIQLGKALNDPATGMSALQRVGVTFTQAQKDQIAAMEKAGNTAGAQAVILKELSKEFGGSAEAAGKANGGMSIFAAQMENVKEQIGQELIPVVTGLLGLLAPLAAQMATGLPVAIQATINAVQTVVGFFQSASPAADAVKVVLIALTGALLGFAASAVPAAITGIVASVTAFYAQAAAATAAAIATAAAALPFILIGAGIALVVAGLYELITHWSQVSAWLEGVWQVVVSAVGAQFSNMGAGLQAVVTGIKTVIQDGFNFVKTVIQDDINDVVAVFQWLYDHNTYFADLVNAIKADFTALKADLTAIWNDITSFFTRAWQGNVELATTVFNAIKSVVTTAFDFVKNIITTDLNFIHTIFTTVWNGLVSIVTSVGGRISGAVTSSVVTPIKTLLGNLASQAVQWGENLIKMFVQGIGNELGAVKNAATNIMHGAASILGFHSPAEEGPGADADTWAPNLMSMFAQGILAGAPDLQNAAVAALSGVRSALAGGATAGVGVGVSGSAGGFLPATATGGLAGALAGAVSSAASGGVGGLNGAVIVPAGTPLVIQVAGQNIGQVFLPDMVKSLRRAGMKI